MKRALANFFLNLATRIGAERLANAPTPRQRGTSALPSAVEAFLTAHPVWGVDEAKATAAFLSSPAGQLFSKRIRSVAAHVAIEGANDRANTIHSAGVSAGWNECVRYIHSLSRVSGDQDIPRAGAEGRLPINLNDRQQPEDEAALLERLSP